MRRSRAVYLDDVIPAADAAISFCAGMTFESYQESLLVRSAVERQFEIIGEAMRQIEDHFPGSLSGVRETQQAKALRNRLAHGYFAIDQGILWASVQDDLPALRSRFASLLAAELP